MSYDISFRAKVEGVDVYVPVESDEPIMNITWNCRDIITKSTGLEWKNEENNGLCIDVIPYIEKGLKELEDNPFQYKQYESPNGWGTVNGTKEFFRKILKSWEWTCFIYPEELTNVLTFWII